MTRGVRAERNTERTPDPDQARAIRPFGRVDGWELDTLGAEVPADTYTASAASYGVCQEMEQD
jgi:hypothetical protein